jgi:hypothetical protein
VSSRVASSASDTTVLGHREGTGAIAPFVAHTENWGSKQRQTMQNFTSLAAGTADSELFKAYMQKLYPAGLNLTKQDFLAQGADPGGKGDYQGCSEFNPVLIFSAQKNEKLESQKDKTARNDANARNRRVIILLFLKTYE